VRWSRLLASGAVALALAGATVAGGGQPRPASLGSGRIALVPLNLGVRVVAEVEPGLEPVERALSEVLASGPSPVVAIDPESAARLWSEASAGDVPGADPLERLRVVRARFTRSASQQLGFETIVFAALITRRARLQGRSARWDGTSQSVEVPGQEYQELDTLRDGPIRISRSGAHGELAAVSLHVSVLSSDGSPRFEGTGGLVLLQELAPPESAPEGALRVRFREHPFDDAEALRRGVRGVFR
jgi:hypothetical protein